VNGDIACLAFGAGGIQVLRIDGTGKAEPLGRYDIPTGAYSLDLNWPYVYVPEQSTLRVLDVSNPTNLVSVGTYDAQGNTWVVKVSG
jgi:hypothetical protein